MNYLYVYDNISRFLPVYVIGFMALEFGILVARERKVLLKETAVNLVSGVVAVATQYVLKTYFMGSVYPEIYHHRIVHVAPGNLRFVYCFFLFSFIHFVIHYINHKVRLFWCLHEVHHSATTMNSSAGIRSSVFDVISTDALYFLIPLLGVQPVVFFIVYACCKIWGSFIHISEHIVFGIPYVHRVLVDPAAHHVHHARNIAYLDKNFGEFVPWYDQLFGTYVRPQETPVYGTLGREGADDFWDVQLGEFRKLVRDVRQAESTADALGYIFMPPGWQPGDASKTVKGLQGGTAGLNEVR